MRFFAAITLTLLISACGWHLRGITPLPAEMKVLHLQSQAGTAFNQSLKLQLEFNGVFLTENAADAPSILQIDAVDIERRPLSISSNGRVSEYELNGRLNARLLRPLQESEVQYELKARRRYTNDINNVTGTANEAREQRKALEQDLVSKLLRRLQKTQFKNGASTPSPATAE